MPRKYLKREHQGVVVPHPALTSKPALARRKRAGVTTKHLHHYTPGATPDVMLSPRAQPQSIPSRTAVPPPSPTSLPLSMGFDNSGSSMDPYTGRSGNVVGGMSEADYYNGQMEGLGQDNFFSDLFTTVSDAYKAQQAAKTAASQAATAQAQAAQAAALKRNSTSLLTGNFLGLTMTTWLMLAGAGVGAYLLLSRKKKRR